MITNIIPTEEMLDFFYKRTRTHINRVCKYLDLIYDTNTTKYKTLLIRKLLHDNSKYYEPEFTPYVFLTWDYHCKKEKIPFTRSKELNKSIQKATYHHCKNNRHHPEFHDENTTLQSINDEDRDKPPEKMVDATGMNEMDIAEMCADWMAMSEEMGNAPQDWAKKNINIRWKFTKNQEKYIYNLLNKVWGN